MGLLTILFSGLLSTLSSAGFIIDQTVENALRSQFEAIEELQVRIDNSPNYQVLQGKVERVRIATRGIQLAPKLRIDVFELETDELDLNIQNLQQGKQTDLKALLRQPFQAGVRLVLTAEDLNQALQSPALNTLLEQNLKQLSDSSLPDSLQHSYELVNPRVELLGNNRLRFQAKLKASGTPVNKSQQLDIILESGIAVLGGRYLQLTEPAVSINGTAVSPQLVSGFAVGLSNRLDLKNWEDAGITARVLKLGVDNDEVEIAAFIRVEALTNLSLLP